MAASEFGWAPYMYCGGAVYDDSSGGLEGAAAILMGGMVHAVS